MKKEIYYKTLTLTVDSLSTGCMLQKMFKNVKVNVWPGNPFTRLDITIIDGNSTKKSVKMLKNNLPINRINSFLIASRMYTGLSMDIVREINNSLKKFKAGAI